jgi:phosphate transport system substrate-binding protein
MSKTIKFLLTVLMLAFLAIPLCLIAEPAINGAGATFPYPVYSQWAYKYNQIAGIKLNYQSIGSGGGIQQIKAKTVDFGASDAPLKAEDLNAVGLIQFPMIIGGVVPVVNIEGIKSGDLQLNAKLLADIYLGKVTKWNDPAIVALNKKIKLPNQDITVVQRADGSGTTWIYTNYLAKVSEDWETKVGAGKAVSWPVGVGGKGNEGVASYVQRIKGSIGYVEYAYALQNNLTYILLQNKAGKYVPPSMETFMASAEGADWLHSEGFYVVLVDQPGEKSWPITGASFIILYKEQTEAIQAQTMLTFFDWCFKHGNEIATELDYVPIPKSVVEIIESIWTKEIKSNGKPIWQ